MGLVRVTASTPPCASCARRSRTSRPPGPVRWSQLDPEQAAAVAAVSRASDPALLVLGAPGTGKTTVALEAVVAAVERGLDAGGRAGPRRRAGAPPPTCGTGSSARLRARPPAGRSCRPPRRRRSRSCGRAPSLLGEPAPTLVSGAEQDLLLGDLLAGHAAGEGVPLAWPPEVRPDVLGLRPFRDELRDLLMRAAERGLTPGRPRRRSATRTAGRRGSAPRGCTRSTSTSCSCAPAPRTSAPGSTRRSSSTRPRRRCSTWEDEVPGAVRPRWRLVVVDDHQESTSATARLLRALADDGARVVLLADPDAAVQTFRGATPVAGRAGGRRRARAG